MFCLICKSVTKTLNENKAKTKNGRNILKGKCAICGSNKSSFVKASKGGSILDSILNSGKIPEMHLPGHNFTGPGTKLEKRLYPDFTPKPWSKPFNKVDEISMHHDICYSKNKNSKTRRICDTKMIEELDNIENPDIRERIDRTIVKPFIWGKQKLGLGLKKV